MTDICWAESLRGDHCSKPRGHNGAHVSDLGGDAYSFDNVEADQAAVDADSRFGGFDPAPFEPRGSEEDR